MELYRRYRPQNLKDVLGCPGTVGALTSMFANNTLPHAVLFHGPSGCGKTTLARICKDELDCHDLDFKEMNSAVYRGIDSVRDIQKNMYMAPSGGPVRVWLLDECHKLSNDAQNAALKMLEDTPSHCYFFLCTTEPGKLITAIKTRCADMPVKNLNQAELEAVLARVLKKETLTLDRETSDALVNAAEGSARAVLVLLDKIRNLPADERLAAVAEGLAAEHEAIELCRALIDNRPWATVAGILKNIKGEPEDSRRAVLGYARAVLLKKEHLRAYIVLDCFKSHFYDSGSAGLALAAFEATKAKE